MFPPLVNHCNNADFEGDLFMKTKIAVASLLAASMLVAQTPQTAPDPGEPHVAAARIAAGEDYQNLFTFLCPAPGARGGRGGGGGGGGGRGGGGAAAGAAAPPRGEVGAAPAAAGAGAQGGRGGGGGGGGQRGTPDRSTWYAEPVKAFDNLYFLGQSEYSVWALQSSEGFILLDAIFDYSVEEEVDGGMKKLGLDPTKIKYAILSHAHADHFG